MIHKTKSDIETQKIGENLAKKFKGGEIVLLYGDLGTGKTQIVKGIARALGINKPITSPTFTFVNEYKIPDKALTFLYHVDLYRIEKTIELQSLGLDDIFNDKKGIVIIEWAEKLKGVPKDIFIVELEYVDEGKRKIKLGHGKG